MKLMMSASGQLSMQLDQESRLEVFPVVIVIREKCRPEGGTTTMNNLDLDRKKLYSNLGGKWHGGAMGSVVDSQFQQFQLVWVTVCVDMSMCVSSGLSGFLLTHKKHAIGYTKWILALIMVPYDGVPSKWFHLKPSASGKALGPRAR